MRTAGVAITTAITTAIAAATTAATTGACASTPPVPVVLDPPPPRIVAPRKGPLRLLVLGDTGKGTDDQRRVLEAARATCAAEAGCHLGLLLGDNVYPNGLDDADDARFATLVEGPYGSLGIPFLAVLGNHDYGAPIPTTLCGGLGLEERRAEAQIAAARRSVVRIPDRHWRMLVGDVELVGLDTQALFFDDVPALAGALGYRDDARRQDEQLRRWNAAPIGRVRIALGHHPWRSAGPHGDAGHYEGIPLTGLVFSGGAIRQFLDARVIGRFDLYLAGHDHGMQDAGDERGTALFVSGGGAEHKPHPARSAVPFYAESLGFLLVDVEGGRARVRIFGVPDEGAVSARLLHERAVGR
ncbi:MAG: hypothetical protein A2138_00720 [Deltaproteobacteria bacterium RBG_16_71_12]|nr:MAG: hypothetical protein A2138_00720 [Deltaproteobacteria bacterium RBG_16_71_12]